MALEREHTPTPGAAGALVARPWWRDRSTLVTGALLLVVAAAAWVGVVRQAADMAGLPGLPGASGTTGMAGVGDAMGDMPGMAGQEGGAGAGVLAPALAFLGAWGVMMAAMMLPSATPMIALYGLVGRNLARSGKHVAPTALFAATYLLVWLLFGVPVYAAGVLVSALASASPTIGALLPYGVAGVLLAAGAYQFSPLKRVCLRACQSPLAFLMTHWRSGYGGTLRLGVVHAVYCVGCCWGLMAVLVAAGAMGLRWVLLIAVAVFAEKLLPRGQRIAWAVGAALLALGLAVVARPDLATALRGQAMAMP
jgi:predicted metal-binding membrane protein